VVTPGSRSLAGNALFEEAMTVNDNNDLTEADPQTVTVPRQGYAGSAPVFNGNPGAQFVLLVVKAYKYL
jgi:hypothetical protein